MLSMKKKIQDRGWYVCMMSISKDCSYQWINRNKLKCMRFCIRWSGFKEYIISQTCIISFIHIRLKYNRNTPAISRSAPLDDSCNITRFSKIYFDSDRPETQGVAWRGTRLAGTWASPGQSPSAALIILLGQILFWRIHIPELGRRRKKKYISQKCSFLNIEREIEWLTKRILSREIVITSWSWRA